MDDWQFVKTRTATTGGAVWKSADGALYMRTGGEDVQREATFQRRVFQAGYPVPEIVASGHGPEGYFFTERSLGSGSLHTEAVAEARRNGRVSDALVRTAAEVAVQLLQAQASSPTPAVPWFESAAFAHSVFEENPDFDTPRIRLVTRRVIDRLSEVPMALGHLDYGLPNVLPAGVIDWQHHGPIPLGYDVYPALDIVAFKGAAKGYDFSPEQRAQYLAALDIASSDLVGRPLSEFLGEFLFIKCFFFLALLRPTDHARPDKHVKWQYRRALFARGIDQYESTGRIDTSTFPTLAEYTRLHG